MKSLLHNRPALLAIALAALAAGLYFTFGPDALGALGGTSPLLLAGAPAMLAKSFDDVDEDDHTPAGIMKLTANTVLDFKARFEQRLDKLDEEMVSELKRRNRPGVFGGGGDDALAPDQRKSLDLAARALLAGDEATARQHFIESKSMRAGNDPSGGYLVLPQVSASMTKVMLEISPLLDAVRIVDLEATDEFEEIIDREDAGVTWVGEVDDRPETDSPELGKFTVPLHELYAQPAVSQKLVDSASVDVMAWLQGKLAEKFANAFNGSVVSGNGAARPLGFLSVPANSSADNARAWGTLQYVASGVSGDFHATAPFDVLDDAIAALKPQYRKEAKWVMNRTTAAKIRKLKTTTGERLWQPSLTAGQPATLLGYPVIEDDFMPAVGANSMSIAFGHFKKGYILVRRLGLRFLVDPYTSKPKVRLYAYQRVGGGVANSEAIKLVKFGTA